MRKSAILAALAALTASHTSAQGIDAYRWKKRPLVVFAQDNSSRKLVEQRGIVDRHRDAFRERDMVVVYVVGNGVSADLGAPPGLSARALRQKYDIRDGEFRAILIGKDGGMKRVAASPLSAAALSDIIDAMPMRRDEVRRRKRG